MTAVVQRVTSAEVKVSGKAVANIGRGLLVLLGVRVGDTIRDADVMADKICSLRVFEDDAGKMNLDMKTVGGKITVVSNFTLAASCAHGRRPDFAGAMNPQTANELYTQFVEKCRGNGIETQTGVFRADMEVGLVNDGPVTFVIDSRELIKK